MKVENDFEGASKNPHIEDEASLKKEKKILNFSLVGSVVILLAEAVWAWITGSMSILMDCIYDTADLIMIGPFLILVPLLYKPTTEKRPYGYAQVESLFVLIKYLVLLTVDTTLVIECIKAIAHGGNPVELGTVAFFEIGMFLVCFIMFIIFRGYEKKFSSPSIRVELFMWKLDALSTLGVAVGFFVSALLENTALSWICPYVDPAIAIIVAVSLAREPIEMIVESIRNLILFAPKQEILDGIEEIVKEKCDAYETEITAVEVIKTGRTYWIEVYFDTDRSFIDVAKLKALDMELENKLEEVYEDVWLELIPDVEEFRHVKPAKKPERKQERIAYVEVKEKNKADKKQKKKV